MFSLRLDKELKKELNALASRQNSTKSKIVKDALIYYLDMVKKETKELSPYELGKEFFGKHGSKKGDLSTTYKQRLKEKIHAKNHNR